MEIFILKKYYQINYFLFKQFIHYGDFYIQKDLSFVDLLKKITKPSNFLNKITIIEGWSQNELNLELSKYFDDYYSIPFEDIIADTYLISKNISFTSFVEFLKNQKNKYFSKLEFNTYLKNYTYNEIMIIGSLLEKEGLNNNDKRIISSVIFNRLNKNMKLQIDATVLYAITDGTFNLNRKLLISDLKTNHPFNTYIIKGLPPKPISYVGKKTLDIIFELNKSEFLFYFFNKSLNKHMFSKTYNEHKRKLNEYRSQK